MAEYIDRESLLKHYIALVKMDWNNKVSPPSWSYAYESFIDYLAELPTVDVVPKSEVERLEEELSKANADVKNYMKVAEYQQSLSIKRYHEIKRLKEDIERLEDINERDVENLRLAKAEVAREIFDELEAILNGDGFYYFFRTFMYDEIRKKYTGGCDD